jgi:hypothetical protein
LQAQGSKLLGIVSGPEVMVMKQTHQRLYNPDHIRDALSGSALQNQRRARMKQ